MSHSKNKRKPWVRALIIVAIFSALVFVIGQAIIFSHPKPLRFYLEFLGRNSQRGLNVSVYTREEFARAYLNLGSSPYQANEFIKLFQEYYNNPPAKENNMFQVYRVIDKTNNCQMNIFGISNKKDLVYVSLENICQMHENKDK